MSENSMLHENNLNEPPLPDQGWSRENIALERAIVVPPTVSDTVQAAGVLTEAKKYCAHGALWRGKRAMTTQPSLPTGLLSELPGRWLYGGLLWVHFGHFLAESTARLWPLPALAKDLDGIVFTPKRPVNGDETRPMQHDFFALLGFDLPMKVVTEPTQVEYLHVPGQGFGLGPIVAGTPEYRAMIHQHFGSSVAPDGPERLYISRAGLGVRRGGVIGEEFLEENMRQNGYEIFYPERHPMEAQIARYKAARQIVALDGSALHLFALVGRPDQQVAMIPRRTSSIHNNIAAQLSAFCGRQPLVANAIRTDWVLAKRGRPNRHSFGELDMGILHKMLAEAGFVSADLAWDEMFWRQRRRTIRKLEAALGDQLIPIHQECAD
ncbi:MAG: glycosyltransferase 61 family protein [Pseudomonadota bacterium]